MAEFQLSLEASPGEKTFYTDSSSEDEVERNPKLRKGKTEVKTWDDRREGYKGYNGNGKAGFKCMVEECNKDYSTSFNNLQGHWASTHLKTIKTFLCKDCDFRSSHLKDMRGHARHRHNTMKEPHFNSLLHTNPNFIDPQGRY